MEEMRAIDHILFDFIYIKHQKRKIYGRRKQICALRGLKVRTGNGCKEHFLVI